MLKKIFKGISMALFGMHLWLPVAYSVIFLVIAAIAGALDGAWPFYFIGLSISFAASLGLTYYMSVRGRRQEPEEKEAPQSEITAEKPAQPSYTPPPAPVQKPRSFESEAPAKPSRAEEYERFENEAARIYEEQVRYSQHMTGTPDSVGSGYLQPHRQDGYARPAEPYKKPEPARPDYAGAQSALDTLYPSFTSSSPSNENRSSFSPYVQPGNVADEHAARLEDYESDKKESEEQPKIYRTRKDPNVLVYEYSDRIEKYYLGEGGTLTFLSSERRK